MKLIKKDWPILLVILIDLIIGFVLYPKLPDQIPRHWNIHGQINGWWPKQFGVFGMPAMILGIYLLLVLLPMIDPRKRNYAKFDKYYTMIKALIVVFVSIVYILTLLAAMKLPVNMKLILPALLGILLVFLGNYMFSVKQNYFIGIRTPWTIESEDVWNRTHRFAGKLWAVSGVIVFIFAFISPMICFILFMTAIFIPAVYSYVIYRNKK